MSEILNRIAKAKTIRYLTAIATMPPYSLVQDNGKIRVQWFEKACLDYETMETVLMTKRGIIHNNGRLQVTNSMEVQR
jgi:hypothetical protein